MSARTGWRMFTVGLMAVAMWSMTLLAATPVSADDGHWRGEYFSNSGLHGSPALVRSDHDIDFDWDDGSPDGRLPDDHFSVRWTRRVHFDAGDYRFKTVSDDGVRVWVDGRLIIDHWHDMNRDSHSAKIWLRDGDHTVKVEYFENHCGASVSLTWDGVDDAGAPVGNIMTCVRPTDSWIKVYRLDGSTWTDVNPRGYGALSAAGNLKLDGMLVDKGKYGDAGHPYRVELWASGSLVRAVGDTAAGQPEFRVRADGNSVTPWGCPAP